MTRTATKSRKISRKAALAKEYGPNLHGAKLSFDGKASPAKDAKEGKKVLAKMAKQTRKQAIQPKAKEYQGAPIQATKLFERTMPEFTNCRATVLLAWNEKANTVTFLNVYNDKLPASYRSDKYTYEYKAKKHDPKMAEMKEIDVTDWPSFVISAAARRSPAVSSRRTK